MYPRQSSNFPGWLAALAGLLLVFGGYYVWRGFMAFMDSSGNIAAPATLAAQSTERWETATYEAHINNDSTVSFIDVAPNTPTPVRPCQDFRVSVIRARIRECPKETCDTIGTPGQGMLVCVYGPATGASDWYEVNMDPNNPLPQIGYMHNSVLDPVNPTAKPTKTFTPLPTVTPLPSLTPSRTPTPLPTVPGEPSQTASPSPTPTPKPPVQTA